MQDRRAQAAGSAAAGRANARGSAATRKPDRVDRDAPAEPAAAPSSRAPGLALVQRARSGRPSHARAAAGAAAEGDSRSRRCLRLSRRATRWLRPCNTVLLALSPPARATIRSAQPSTECPARREPAARGRAPTGLQSVSARNPRREAVRVVALEAQLLRQEAVERGVRGQHRHAGGSRLVDGLVRRAGADVVDERVGARRGGAGTSPRGTGPPIVDARPRRRARRRATRARPGGGALPPSAKDRAGRDAPRARARPRARQSRVPSPATCGRATSSSMPSWPARSPQRNSARSIPCPIA